MPEFLVRWSIKIDAETHHEAANEALRLLRTPDADVTSFSVQQWHPRMRFYGQPVEIDPMVDAG